MRYNPTRTVSTCDTRIILLRRTAKNKNKRMAGQSSSSHVKIICSFVGAVLLNFSATMIVPILPLWLDWCDYLNNFTLSNESPEHSSSEEQQCSESDYESTAAFLDSFASSVEIGFGPIISAFSVYLQPEFLGFIGLLLSPVYLFPYAFGHGYIMYAVIQVSAVFYSAIAEVAYLVQLDSVYETNTKTHLVYRGLFTLLIDIDIFGPTYSGILYHYFGKKVAFLSLLVVIVPTLVVYMVFGVGCKFNIRATRSPQIKSQSVISDDTSYKTLLADQQVLCISCLIILAGLQDLCLTV